MTYQDRGRSALRRIAVVGDAMTARVQVALLESAGIEAHLKGEGLGPYPVTVGRLAEVEIWVAEDDREDAEALLGEADALAPRPPAPVDVKAPPSVPPVLALVMAALLGLAVVLAAMRIF